MEKSTVDPQREEQEYRHRIYLDERKALVESEQRSAEQFDRNILTLAASALALSLVFLEKIVPKPIPSTLMYLYTSWSALVGSLLLILCSFLTSQMACRRQRDILEQKVENPDASEPRNISACVTRILNWSSIVAFVAGVAALTFFSIMNLK